VWLETGIHFAETPPIGLLWVAACLRDDGYDVQFLDAENLTWNYEQTVKWVVKSNPDIVGVTCTTLGFNAMKKLIDLLKQEMPKVITVLGGPHASILREATFNEIASLDYVCVNDGFFAIQKIPCNSRVLDGGMATDFNQIPQPEWGLIEDMTKYTGNSPVLQSPSLDSFTSMGCPFPCVYCSRPEMFKRVRYRAADLVINELEHFTKRGVKELFLYNDEWNLKLSHCYAICNAIIDAKRIGKVDPHMIFKAQTRTSKTVLPEDLVKTMAEAGFKVCMWGIEAGSPKVLKAIQKGTTVEDNERALRLAHKYGIKNWAFTMTQNFEETWSDVEMTHSFIRRNSKYLDWLQVTIATPYHGTTLYDRAFAEGWVVNRDLSTYYTHRSVMRTPWMTAEEAEKAQTYLLGALGMNRWVANKLKDTFTTYKGLKRLPSRTRKLARWILTGQFPTTLKPTEHNVIAKK